MEIYSNIKALFRKYPVPVSLFAQHRGLGDGFYGLHHDHGPCPL